MRRSSPALAAPCAASCAAAHGRLRPETSNPSATHNRFSEVWAGRGLTKAAHIVFALTVTSAASERVFSLVKSMYGKGRDSSLADELQGSVMLRYNKRSVPLRRLIPNLLGLRKLTCHDCRQCHCSRVSHSTCLV